MAKCAFLLTLIIHRFILIFDALLIASDPAVLFAREPIGEQTYISQFSVNTLHLRTPKARAFVKHNGEDSSCGTSTCSKDLGSPSCAHITSAREQLAIRLQVEVGTLTEEGDVDWRAYSPTHFRCLQLKSLIGPILRIRKAAKGTLQSHTSQYSLHAGQGSQPTLSIMCGQSLYDCHLFEIDRAAPKIETVGSHHFVGGTRIQPFDPNDAGCSKSTELPEKSKQWVPTISYEELEIDHFTETTPDARSRPFHLNEGGWSNLTKLYEIVRNGGHPTGGVRKRQFHANDEGWSKSIKARDARSRDARNTPFHKTKERSLKTTISAE